MSLNKVILIGNLGKDPEIRTLDGGNTVANFSIATSRKWTNKEGEKQEETEWHNIVFWGKTVETIEKWVKKGSCISVVGRLATRKWTDKDGNDRYTTEIVGNEWSFEGSKGETATQAVGTKVEEDDIPF